MRHNLQSTGFTAPPKQGQERGTVASLIASAVLALGTMIAATAVTVGIAHASAADSIIAHEGSLFAVALLLGLLFIGVSGITLFSPRGQKHRH
jgi:hypothetical protein